MSSASGNAKIGQKFKSPKMSPKRILKAAFLALMTCVTKFNIPSCTYVVFLCFYIFFPLRNTYVLRTYMHAMHDGGAAAAATYFGGLLPFLIEQGFGTLEVSGCSCGFGVVILRVLLGVLPLHLLIHFLNVILGQSLDDSCTIAVTQEVVGSATTIAEAKGETEKEIDVRVVSTTGAMSPIFYFLGQNS